MKRRAHIKHDVYDLRRRIMFYVTARGCVGPTEIARHVCLPKSTVNYHMWVLTEMGYLRKDDGKRRCYRAAVKFGCGRIVRRDAGG